jgi:hypothetical protein
MDPRFARLLSLKPDVYWGSMGIRGATPRPLDADGGLCATAAAC